MWDVLGGWMEMIKVTNVWKHILIDQLSSLAAFKRDDDRWTETVSEA